jgi:hypothetical protein
LELATRCRHSTSFRRRHLVDESRKDRDNSPSRLARSGLYVVEGKQHIGGRTSHVRAQGQQNPRKPRSRIRR